MSKQKMKISLLCCVFLLLICTSFIMLKKNEENVVYDIPFFVAEQEEVTQEQETMARSSTIEDCENCNNLTSSHGDGRELGYNSEFLSIGCRNYKISGFHYGITEIPYYIDETTMTMEIANKFREVIEYWNDVEMHDGSGKLVNFYEVFSTSNVNGRKVLRISKGDTSDEAENANGYFKSGSFSVKIDDNFTNYDTVLHELGHALGLDDLDTTDSDEEDVHTVLMGYDRANLNVDKAIKYQDIQGVAVANGIHTNHQFDRYVRNGDDYVHLCFYCDLMDIRSSAISGSSAMVEANVCLHDYQQLVSAGDRHWVKCKRCYKVVESDFLMRGYAGVNAIGEDMIYIEIVKFLNPEKSTLTIESRQGGLLVGKIGAAAFKDCVNLTSITFNNYVPVETIGNSAFEGCINLTSFDMPSSVVSIEKDAFKGCTSLTELTIPSHVTSIGEQVFVGCNNLTINVNANNSNYCAENNVLYNKAKTEVIAAGKVNANVTLPSTVNFVLPYAFYGNTNLRTLSIESNQLEILDFAFYGCNNLEKVYCYTSAVPTLGISAFPFNQMLVYAPYNTETQFLEEFAGYVNDIKYIPVQITFKSDEEVVSTLNTYYGASIDSVPTLNKDGYTFGSWYSEANGAGQVFSTVDFLEAREDLTVQANWIPNTYSLCFEGEGTENLADQQVTYGQAVGELPTVSVPVGYTFHGWKTEQGEYVTTETIWQTVGNLTVYPDIRITEHTIYLDANGWGYMEEDCVTVEHGAIVYSLPKPIVDDWFVFTEWNTEYDGSGQAIATPFMYQISSDLTLYAQCVENVYEVVFDKQGGVGGSNGYSEYDSDELIAPTKPGYLFLGYYDEPDGYGSQYIDADMYMYGDLSDFDVLYAYWQVKDYYVTVDNQGGEDGSIEEIYAVYFDWMPEFEDVYPPWKDGYLFDGYYENPNGMGMKYYDAELNPVGLWNQDCEDVGVMYANWIPEVYTVTLHKRGGIGGTDSVQVTYGADMPTASAPTKEGYEFRGYYSGTNGTGQKYYNADMTSARAWDITYNDMLYAYWYGEEYEVTLDVDGSAYGIIDVVYGLAMPNGFAPPVKQRYEFLGFFDSDGIQYYDSQMTSMRAWDKHMDGFLQARWRGVYYSIEYRNVSFMGQTASIYWNNEVGSDIVSYYEYGVGRDLSNVTAAFSVSSQYSPQFVFLGWYRTMDFTTEVTQISAAEHDIVVLYAKWRYDFTSGSRTADYTITDDDPYTAAYYDNFYINFGTVGLHQALLDMGITKVYLEFKIAIREIDDAYQEILIYDGTSASSTLLCSCANIEHTPGETDENEQYYKFMVCFDISDILNVNTLVVRYGAHGKKGSDNWVTSEIYYETMYIKDNADVAAKDFTWEYQDTIDDSICNTDFEMTYHV